MGDEAGKGGGQLSKNPTNVATQTRLFAIPSVRNVSREAKQDLIATRLSHNSNRPLLLGAGNHRKGQYSLTAVVVVAIWMKDMVVERCGLKLAAAG